MPTDTALAQVASATDPRLSTRRGDGFVYVAGHPTAFPDDYEPQALPARPALPAPPRLPLPQQGSRVVLRVGGTPFVGILRDYGTPVPAPVERSPFAADPEPRPDATRQQGR